MGQQQQTAAIHHHQPRPPSASLNPLTLPNLQPQQQQQTIVNVLANTNVTNVPQQNGFSNYIDRYQRCRNIISLNKQQQQQSIPSNSNSPIQQVSNQPNGTMNAAQLAAAQQQLGNMLYGHAAPPNTNNRRVTNSSFMQDYQELLAGYKKLEQANEQQQLTIDQMKMELNSYRNAMNGQPLSKR